MIRNLKNAAFVGCVFILNFGAHANVLIFDDSAQFSASTNGATTYGFNEIDMQGYYVISAPQTVHGVTFSSTGSSNLYSVGASSYGVQTFSGQSTTALPTDVIMTLQGVFAVGVRYGAAGTAAGTPVTISLSSGEQYVQYLPALAGRDTNFIGLVSTTPIESLTFTTIDHSINGPIAYSLEVVDFVLASPVPEPSTWTLCVLGAALVLNRGRRHTQASDVANSLCPKE